MLVHSELPEKPEKLRLWTIIQQVGWRIASTCGRVRLNNIKQAKNIVWSLSWWSSWDLFRISWGSCTTARVLVCWDFSVPGEECTRFLSKVKIKDQSIWIQGKINENLLLIHWELYIGRRKSFEIPYLLNYCLCFTSWAKNHAILVWSNFLVHVSFVKFRSRTLF